MVHRGYVGVMFPYSEFNTSSKNILGGFRLHGLAPHGQNNQEKPWRISLLAHYCIYNPDPPTTT